jgi:hypothetical protein
MTRLGEREIQCSRMYDALLVRLLSPVYQCSRIFISGGSHSWPHLVRPGMTTDRPETSAAFAVDTEPPNGPLDSHSDPPCCFPECRRSSPRIATALVALSAGIVTASMKSDPWGNDSRAPLSLTKVESWISWITAIAASAMHHLGWPCWAVSRPGQRWSQIGCQQKY